MSGFKAMFSRVYSLQAYVPSFVVMDVGKHTFPEGPFGQTYLGPEVSRLGTQ